MNPLTPIDPSTSPAAGLAGTARQGTLAPYDGPEGVGGAAPVAAPVPFAELVTRGLSQVNEQLIGSQLDLQKLAVGDAQNLHQIMINLEETRVSFQLMMQVRNRLLEAYQDLMKMPV